MAKELNSIKIDSKITPTLLRAIYKYMDKAGENKSGAIRVLLTSALRTEKLLDELTK